MIQGGCHLIFPFSASAAGDGGRSDQHAVGDGDSLRDTSKACLFSFRRKITIRHVALGESCPASIPDYPLLVVLTGGWLRTRSSDPSSGRIASTLGHDIVFSTEEGRALDHEIELYDGIEGRLVAWVRIPTLSHTVDTVIYLYYGNALASVSSQRPNALWGSSQYAGVWHLGEANGQVDSTSHGSHGTPSGATLGVPGKIGGARQVSREPQGTVSMGDPVDGHLDLGGAGDFTIELWLNLEHFYYYPPFLVSKRGGYASSSWGYSLHVDDDEQGIPYYEVSYDGPVFQVLGSTPLLKTGWRHLVYVFDHDSSANSTIYVDGKDDKRSASGVTGPADGPANSRPFRLNGESPPHYEHMFDGVLDEVRVSRVVRDACWVATNFNNQDDPGSFYSVGGEEEDFPACVSD
jgi:hypothetical protein